MDVASGESLDETGVSEPGTGATALVTGLVAPTTGYHGSEAARSLRSLSAAGAFRGRWGIIGRALAIRGRRLLGLRVIWPFR